MRSRRLDLPVPQMAALGAVAVGLLLIVVGFVRAGGVVGGTATSTQRLTTDAPVLMVGPGQLGQGAQNLTLRATGAAGSPVFLGAGRADDVQAYLGDAPWADLTDDGGVDVREHSGTGRPSDPRRSDIWAVLSTGTATTTLIWPETPGRWSLVAAGDGTSAAPAVQVSWTHPATRSGAPWWWSGGLLTFVGVLGLALLRGLIPLPARRPAVAGALRSLPRPSASDSAEAPTQEPTQESTQPRTRAEARARLRGRTGISATPSPAPGIAATPADDAPPPPLPAPPPSPAPPPPPTPAPAAPLPDGADDAADDTDDDEPPAVLPFRRPRRSQP